MEAGEKGAAVRVKPTRETIVRVSTQLFLRKSFKEVTVKEVVEQAGVSQGAFFHYFKTKDELFLEIVEHALQSVLDAHSGELRRESLHAYYQDYAEWLTGGERDLDLNYFALFFDAIKLFPQFRAKLDESRLAELNAWKEVVRAARSSGEIRSAMTDEQIARMFMYSSDGVGLHGIFSGGEGQATKRALLDLWDGFYAALKA